MKKIIALLLMLMLLTLPALADTLEATGTVTATMMQTLLSPANAPIDTLFVQQGDHVDSGASLLRLKTTAVYATQDGTVRVFGQVGDATDAITSRYGAVVYLEPAQRYTISASTKSAYSSDDTKLIHAGETVYLRATSNTKLTGTGTVTSVSGTSYTVEVDGTPFTSGLSINIYRDSAFAASSMLGSGKTAQASAVLYTGSGYLTTLHVTSGQSVKAGDCLFETLEGDFTPGDTDMAHLRAPTSGVIAAIYANSGSMATAQESLIDFYPDDGLRIFCSVPEEDTLRIHAGDSVSLLLPGEEAASLSGHVEKVSLLPDDTTTYGTTYTVSIIPDTLTDLRYGMQVTVQFAE